MDILEYYEVHTGKQMALVFSDAQKAFDNVSWQFMGQVSAMDFAVNFINVIEAIYNEQTARIIVNNELTENINIKKGTRQGCPFSPLLFILTLEMLNREVCFLRLKKEVGLAKNVIGN